MSSNNKIISYLNHLKLINEFLSCNITGEARYELHKLKNCIISDENLNPEIKTRAISLCEIACTNMISRNNEKVAPCIFSLNQMALKAAMHCLEKNTIIEETTNKDIYKKAVLA